MPHLSLDHCAEPFAGTLGVMLYPGTDDADQRKARAFATQFLAEPFRRFLTAGHTLAPEKLADLLQNGGEPLIDLEKRWQGGLEVGEMFKALFALACTRPELCSWNNAAKIYVQVSTTQKSRGTRSFLYDVKKQFGSVAHLWGAWCIREGQFTAQPGVGYSGFDDFRAYLTEAEILRDFGQHWRAKRKKSKPLLPPDLWRATDNWFLRERKPGWPNTGMIPYLSLPDNLLKDLKPSGRPRKQP